MSDRIVTIIRQPNNEDTNDNHAYATRRSDEGGATTHHTYDDKADSKHMKGSYRHRRHEDNDDDEYHSDHDRSAHKHRSRSSKHGDKKDKEEEEDDHHSSPSSSSSRRGSRSSSSSRRSRRSEEDYYNSSSRRRRREDSHERHDRDYEEDEAPVSSSSDYHYHKRRRHSSSPSSSSYSHKYSSSGRYHHGRGSSSGRYHHDDNEEYRSRHHYQDSRRRYHADDASYNDSQSHHAEDYRKTGPSSSPHTKSSPSERSDMADYFSQTTTATFDDVKAGDREKRTISVSRLPPTINESEIEQFLAGVGKVRTVKLIRDKFTGRTRGLGFVEFYEESSVYAALALNGSLLKGFPILIKASEAERNVSHGSQGHSQGITKLYVSDIPSVFDEDDLSLLFSCFGSLLSVELKEKDEEHRTKYAYVKFSKPESARKALLKIHCMDLGYGYRLKVGLWNETKAMEARENEGEIDVDKEGIGLTAQQRIQMMANFNVNQNKTEVQHVVAAPSLSAPLEHASTMFMATKNIRLTNMFERQEMEERPDYREELERDVAEECSNFGPVLFVFVDVNTPGHVYVKFADEQSAIRAHEKMNGRWFAAKQLTSEFLSDASFKAKTGYKPKQS